MLQCPDQAPPIAGPRPQSDSDAYRRSLFEQRSKGVLVLDRDHRVMDANAHAASMLGRSPEDLLQSGLADLVAAAELPLVLRALDELVAHEVPATEQVFARADGAPVQVEMTMRRLDSTRTLVLLTDISARLARERQLHALSQAVEQSSESILITDLAACIEYVNRAALASSGYSRAELIGRNASILQSGQTPPATYEAMWSRLRQGQPWKGLLFNRRRNGSEYVEFAGITPIRNPAGEVTHFLAVKEDVTEKKRMGEELDRHRHHLEELVAQRTAELTEAKRAAIASSEAKSAFLAAMSHEIRTPMNGVIGIVDVLRQSSLDGYQTDLANTIRESAFALLGIIDSILDFSKIEAGHMVLEREPVALQQLAESIGEGLQPVAGDRGVRLSVYVDPALPGTIVSDALRLRQILNNLIGNAIKFSAGLERSGRVSLRAVADGDGKLRLQVSDNGIGIAPEKLARVFEPFEQAEGSTTRRYGGTGLGLTICRRLAEALGGTIEIQSTPGVGTTIAAVLPIVQGEAAPAGAAAADSALAGVDCHIVLSDPAQARDWCSMLKAAGAQAHSWPALQDFNARPARAVAPPLVLVLEADAAADALDADGRAAGGAAALHLVRLQPGARRRPRLLGPGRVSLDTAALRREALLQAVLLACGRATPAPEEFGRTMPPGAVVAPSIEQAVAQGRLVLVAEDNDINRKVIQRQLALLGIAVDVANDGLAALERWRSGRYGLLLTDLHMPGLDGYQLTAAIRQEEGAGRRLPIIALTANALQGEDQRCRAAGMDDYISKPVQLELLGAKLARWLPPAADPGRAPPVAGGAGQRSDGAGAAGPARAAAPALPVAPALDERVLAALIGDDAALIAEFLSDYAVSAAASATELRAAAALDRWDTVAGVAHRLKSSSASVGALGLADTCARIESAGEAGEVPALQALLPAFEAELTRVLRHLEGGAVPLAAAPELPADPAPVVLLVDDDPQFLQLLEQQLAALGIGPVQACRSGAQALDWLQGRSTASLLILLDLNMPEMDGIKFMRHLSERGYEGMLGLVSGADLRVLQTASKLALAYRLNVLGHQQKPFTPDRLSLLVDRWRAHRPAEGHTVQASYAPQEIRLAIAAGQLRLLYQPSVNLADGRCNGVEALVRWQHPRDGLLSPNRFLAVAEGHGLIDELTQAVLRIAIDQAACWRAAGLTLRMAVNVSMHNLARLDFPDFVDDELARHGLPAQQLALEVTESRLMHDVHTPMDILTRLHLKGIGLSIDDFGTGQSSMSQLRGIPFNELKIDRSVVRGCRAEDAPRALFATSLAMAQQLGMKAVAEGVEDRSDWDFVRAAGCDHAQGYFIGRPMVAEALPQWAAQWRQTFENLG